MSKNVQKVQSQNFQGKNQKLEHYAVKSLFRDLVLNEGCQRPFWTFLKCLDLKKINTFISKKCLKLISS